MAPTSTVGFSGAPDSHALDQETAGVLRHHHRLDRRHVKRVPDQSDRRYRLPLRRIRLNPTESTKHARSGTGDAVGRNRLLERSDTSTSQGRKGPSPGRG
jgi:hypothetical protein